ADGSDAIGTAEQFRPYYDIMFAPNNARGLALASPSGLGYENLTFVAAGNTGRGTAASPIKVLSCADLAGLVGKTILVGATSTTVTSCAGTNLVVNSGSGLTSAPAAGTTILFAATVPFEGPFSLLDIVGLAGEGKGGAALSNYVPGSIRDTAETDG